MKFLSKEFWDGVLIKITETMISVKVWTIFSVLLISTYLLMNGFISDSVWGSVNSGIIATVFALRESFKIARIKIKNNVTNTRKEQV